MKTKILLTLIPLLGLLTGILDAAPLGTVFTYHGRLDDSGSPANGTYEFRFTVYGAAMGGNALAGPLTSPNVPVSNGLFVVQLDFGAGVFNGDARWLEIAVHTNDSVEPFVTLAPRQPLTATPYALHALSVTLSNGAITSEAINNGTILPTDLDVGSFGTTFWKVDGNAGTSPASHFLGTTDNQPLHLRVNNSRVLRLELNGNSPNLIGGFAANNVLPGVVGATIGGGGGHISAANSAGANWATISGGSGHAAAGFASFIGGGENNNIGSNANHSVISGGVRNVVEPDALGAAIAGGENNQIRRSAGNTTIGGGFGNSVLMNAIVNVIAGGQGNLISSNVQYSAIGGGLNNTLSAGATYVNIGGGQGNTIENLWYGAIGGGAGNTIARGADYATIGGGLHSRIETNAWRATIAGGDNNEIGFGAARATIGGGWNNAIETSSSQSVIGGGSQNRIRGEATYGTISGGSVNTIEPFANYGTIGGGLQNRIGSGSATIGGGFENEIQDTAPQATIAGGWNNTIETDAQGATISGGRQNSIQRRSEFSAIAGGLRNAIGTNSEASVIGGGEGNSIAPDVRFSTIAGGVSNDIGSIASLSAIGGGFGNWIQSNAFASTIGGGVYNTIEAHAIQATISGGYRNAIWTNATSATIGGGEANYIAHNSRFATVPGGGFNEATNYAFAAGYRAKAKNKGAFVWADSQDSDFASTTDDQFRVRAEGGVRFDVNDGAWVQIRHISIPFVWSHLIQTSTGAYLSSGGAWVDSSDRNQKEHFEPVDSREILRRVVTLPLTTWNYRREPHSLRHIGPTAQDFYDVFGVGADDKHIAALDANGVALAAIQGLNQKLEDEIKAKDARISTLENRLAALEQLLSSITSGQTKQVSMNTQ